MKILAFSDTHSYKSCMIAAIELESPDLILHMGDHDKDCAEIEQKYPQIPLRCVKGNCDRMSSNKDVDEFTFAGKRFFITHGHQYGVKTGLKDVIKAAYENGADILLFGHTHIPYTQKFENMLIINPGSAGSSSKTYAVLEIKNGDVVFEIKNG